MSLVGTYGIRPLRLPNYTHSIVGGVWCKVLEVLQDGTLLIQNMRQDGFGRPILPSGVPKVILMEDFSASSFT